MEKIGDGCFCKAGIEEVMLPSTMEKIGKFAFEGCSYLSAIWFEDDCLVDVKNSVNNPVAVLRADTMIGG